MPLSDHDVVELRATAEVALSAFAHDSIEEWQAATLAAFAGLLGVTRGNIVTSTDGSEGHALTNMNVDAAQLAEYERDWLAIDLNESEAGAGEAIRRGICAFTRDSLWHGEGSDPAYTARYARSAIWNEYYRKYGATEGGGYAVLNPTAGGPAVLVDYLFVFDADESNPRVRAEGLRLLNALEPAFRAGSAMARMRSRLQGSLLSCIDALPGPVALLNRSGRYLHQNPAWRVAPAANGAHHEVDRAAIGLARMVTGIKPTHPTNGHPLIPARVVCAGWLMTATRFDVPGQASPLALLHAELQAPTRTNWLARAVAAGLPPRLTQVAAMIAQGLTNGQIADQLHIRPTTARRHTERVLARLRVTRRSAVAAALDANSPGG